MSYICTQCPRKCGIIRDKTPSGVCRSPHLPTVSRAAPHYGEEPCISGSRGSGAVFFSGCNLRCVFCQNSDISRGNAGVEVDAEGLADIFLRLQDSGVHNINLVTATHFSDTVADALRRAKLSVPVVWNSSGYESVETLKTLDGLVDIYMPDYKYAKRELAEKYSAAPDYPTVAREAILEMYRQTGPYRLDKDGIMTKGVLIRHLVLPENELNSMDVIDFVAESFPSDSVLFSLMGQYTPMPGCEAFPELTKRIDPDIYDMLCSYAVKCGIESGYFQDPASATDEMIPDFDLTGV